MGNDIIKPKRAEEALRDANQFNIEIVSQAGEGIVVYDRNLRYVVWNQFMERLTGALAEDVIGRKALDLFPHLIEQGVDKLLKRALNGETVTSSDTPFHSPFTNQKGWMVGTYAPHRNALSEIIGVIATVRDITERKRTEEALRESEERYRTVVSSASDGIILQESTGKILTWNTTVENVFGVKAAEALDHTSDLRNWRTIREDGSEFSGDDHPSVHTLMTGEPCKNVVMGVRNATNDQLSWISISTSPLFRGGEPKPYAVVISFSDITERKKAEMALRDSENKLAAIIEFLPDATFVIDMDGMVIAWNRAIEEMTGISKSDMIGQGDHAYTVPFYGERRQHLLDLLDKDEKEIASKYQYVQRKGEILYAETFTPALYGSKGAYVWATVGPIFDVQGNCVGAIESIRDITDRKRAEEELRRIQSSMRIAMDLVKLVRWEYDVETDMFAFDDQFYALYGTTAEREGGPLMSSKDYARKFIPAEDASMVAEEISKALATTDPNFTSQVEHRIIHADGTEGYIAVRFGIIKDSKGRTIKTYGANQDITERKRTEDALRQAKQAAEDSKARYEQVVSMISDIVWRYDVSAQGENIGSYISPVADRMLGLPDGTIGNSFEKYFSYVHPDDLQRVQEMFSQGIKTLAKDIEADYRLQKADGTTIWVRSKGSAYPQLDGRATGVGTTSNITERKRSEVALRKAHDELEIRVKERTEELSKKNAEMEQFIYTVSHDLRTPLISVSGFLWFIEQDAQKGDLDRLKNDLRITNEAVTKMDRLLMETLELSRIGRVVDPPEDVPFGEIVEDALEQASKKIRSSGFKVTVTPNLPVVRVDRMRIAEALVNLIENSMKYMGLQAYPEIEIGQRIEGQDRVFFVRDNGIGIDPSQTDKVFELFYKVDKKSEGIGAGLAIVKKIIEVHGGRIWIESELGKGCTVCFTLPLT